MARTLTAIFEQIAVLSEGVMRASQLSARQQDVKKSVRAVGHIDISKRNIKSELIEHPCRECSNTKQGMFKKKALIEPT